MVIEDDHIARIISEIDDWDDYSDIEKSLRERFPEWGESRIGGFTSAISTKVKHDKFTHWKRDVIELRTTPIGKPSSRYSIVRDNRGVFLGREKNIQFYSKAGDGLWGVNTRTGRRAKLG